jgi:hypothetical protein
MKNTIITIFDTSVVFYVSVLFILHTLVVSEINISLIESVFVLSTIAYGTIPYIIFGFIIGLLTKQNVIESLFPLRLNNSFRVMIAIQIVWHLILWNDSFKHPLSYDFKFIPFRRYFIKDLPLYIWFLRVFFQRLFLTKLDRQKI